MSYLWMDAAAAQRTAGWWNDRAEFEHERGEYSVRNPAEKLRARRNRYVSQIVDRHNVTRTAAREAMMHVAGHLEDNYATHHPTEYGFASAPPFARDHYSHEMTGRLMDPETWRHRPVEQVPTDEIHASQHFIRPHSVAHNLFWPGHRQPISEEETGDPDIEPEPEEPDIEDDYEYESADERELHRNAKFLERANGRIECVDGHHRAAADMILGKKTTPGQLITERELMRPKGYKPHPWPMTKEKMTAHLAEHHGWDPETLNRSWRDNFRVQDQIHDREHLNFQRQLEHDHE